MATINTRLGELLDAQRDLSLWEGKMPGHNKRKEVRDTMRDEIAADWRAMVEALEKQAICQPYRQTCATCVNRARATLARVKGG